MVCNGYWEVDSAEAGMYRFFLRRWPLEEDAKITAAVPGGTPVPFGQLTIDSGWGGGVALPIRQARIAIAGQEASTWVDANTASAVFTLSLSAGPTHLQTWFVLDDGEELGAYYVYVEKIG